MQGRCFPVPCLSESEASGVYWGVASAASWFSGLLPEGEQLRRAIAEAHGARDITEMGLLEKAGLDCAGAVQITSEAELPEREQRFEPISHEEIARRLHAANNGQPVAEDRERWSVAGQQGKLALHKNLDGQWGRAVNGLPTTHIIKPGITFAGRDMIEDQALTEHLTLAAARALGVPAAHSEFLEFNGAPAVVVERYDRIWIDDSVHRLHQEDLCQSLGIGPERKYEERGGPGVAAVAALLNAVAGSPEDSAAFRLSFAMMVMFNHFSGSPDAHAKNYSVFILPDNSVVFAPMYDAASGLGYSRADSTKLRFSRNAMRIGHHDHFQRVTASDWAQFVQDIGLPANIILNERNRIAQEPPGVFRALLDSGLPHTSRRRILNGPLLTRMEELCNAVSLPQRG